MTGKTFVFVQYLPKEQQFPQILYTHIVMGIKIMSLIKWKWPQTFFLSSSSSLSYSISIDIILMTTCKQTSTKTSQSNLVITPQISRSHHLLYTYPVYLVIFLLRHIHSPLLLSCENRRRRKENDNQINFTTFHIITCFFLLLGDLKASVHTPRPYVFCHQIGSR